jgi:hypothetical protein
VSFISPLAFLGLLLAIPILLMYMLRLRRREQMVSSTFLWQQVLQDQEANTPWQRLRRNLLLILQLLILAALILALARPFALVPAISAARVVIVLDASVSMAARDGVNGGSRFADAQVAAIDLIDSLSSDSEVSILLAAQTPEILAPYTSDRSVANAAVRSAQPSAGEADWLAALTLASAGANGEADFTLVMITDGGLTHIGSLNESAIPARVRVIPVGTAADNIALTALATRALPGGQPQLFAQITNTGVSDAEVILSLRADDNPVPLVSQRYSVPAGSSLPITSTAPLPDDVQVLSASITTTVNSVSADLLNEDNTAYAVIREAQPRTILVVTDDNLFLEQVLATLPGVRAFKAPPGRPLPAQPFDLTIFDRTLPTTLPTGDVMFIAPPGSVSGMFGVGGDEIGAVGRLVGAEGDERLTFVDLQTVSVLKYRPLADVGWADALVTAGGVPLVVAGERDGRRVSIFAFALADSDLPLQIAFPVLMSNLLEWFTPQGILEDTALSIGQPEIIRPPLDAESVRVTAPNGRVRELAVESGEILYADTSQIGVYRVDIMRGGAVVQTESFAVNLFSLSESDITPRPASLNGQPLTVNTTDEQGQWEFWPILALIALFILLLEWNIYHRRQTVRPVAAPVSRRNAAPRRAP